MSYISKTLGAHETLFYRARFHWLHWAGAWLALIFLGIALIGIYLFVRWLVFAATTEIAVTSHRVVFKTGLFRRDTQDLPLSNIELITIHQGFWGRLFGFGRLTIHGSGDDQINLPSIANPLAFRKAIEDVRS